MMHEDIGGPVHPFVEPGVEPGKPPFAQFAGDASFSQGVEKQQRSLVRVADRLHEAAIVIGAFGKSRDKVGSLVVISR
jgi:hypothetical protein